MTSLNKTITFEKTIEIPEALCKNYEVKVKDTVYWYIHVDGIILKLSLSVNEETQLPNIIYHTTNQLNSQITFPDEIVNIFKLEGQKIRIKVDKSRPYMTIQAEKKIKYPKNKLNTIVHDETTSYSDAFHGIAIPLQGHNIKKFEDGKVVFCSIYQEENSTLLILNDAHEAVNDPKYKLKNIHLAHIKTFGGKKLLILDEKLRKTLRLEHGEEINWKIYYHRWKLFVGFRKIHYEEEIEEENPDIEIFKKFEEYYMRLPRELVELLTRNRERILWKRYKHANLCKINLTADEPRYYKHRKTGKIIENTDITSGVTPIPERIISRLSINKNTQVIWKINSENKRYKYIELAFN